MPASTIVTVLYPSSLHQSFDMSYYLSTHMPLVEKSWGQYGLQSWKIVQLPAEAPYSVQAILEFDSAEGFQRAQSSEEAKVVMGDVPNFAKEGPVFLAGGVVGKMV
jgi:uncharacterized protein (TIGR02118 family)